MSPDLEHQLIANVATILERSENQTDMLKDVLVEQRKTNGRVTTLEKGHVELKTTVETLKQTGTELHDEIKKGNKFIDAIKNNWKGAAFVVAIGLWIYEHGFIHI